MRDDIFSWVLGFRYALVRAVREAVSHLQFWLYGSVIRCNDSQVANITVFVVNLEHRKDRWKSVSSELRKFDFLKYERLPAVKFSPGYIGCNISHVLALSRAVERRLPVVMICEDDVVFVEEVDYTRACIEEFLTGNAEVLCLGHNSKVSVSSGPFLRRSLHTQTASCYLVKQSAYGWLLKNFTESLGMAVNDYDYKLCAIDQHWKVLQLKHEFLIPCRRVAVQSESYSDIENRIVDYRH